MPRSPIAQRETKLGAPAPGPVVIHLDLTDLPRRLDRRAGAALVTQHFFPISYRTLEAAPLTWRLVNGRALVETADLVAWAQSRVDAAAPVRGGRRRGCGTAQAVQQHAA